MRSLLQPATIKRAGIAALLTALACWPRLALWTTRRDAVWLLLVFLLWTAFFLWSSVFAWHEKYSGSPVFRRAIPTQLWVIVTLFGVGGALVHRHYLDPVLRAWAPLDFPRDLASWGAMLLFSLALEQLFLCFAPFAFFVRLFQRIAPAMIGTILVSVFVMLLRLRSTEAEPSSLVLAALVLFRVAGTWLVLHFYLKGGILLVWWWGLLVQSRHLPDILTAVAGK